MAVKERKLNEKRTLYIFALMKGKRREVKGPKHHLKMNFYMISLQKWEGHDLKEREAFIIFCHFSSKPYSS